MKIQQSAETWYAAGDPWVLTQSEWNPGKNIYYETIFTQSNGYMGIRAYTEEVNAGLKSHREGYMAGVFGHTDKAALAQTRVRYKWPMLSMITLPELFACQITLNNEVFSLSTGRLEFFGRSLDMRDGSLSRHVEWTSPGGRRTRLQFVRFLSAAMPHLAMQKITITPVDWSGPATVEFVLDGTIPTYFRCGDRSFAHLPQKLLLNPRVVIKGENAAILTVKTRGTEHTVSVASEIIGAPFIGKTEKRSKLRQKASLVLARGQSQTLCRAVAVVSSRDGIPVASVPSRAAGIAADAVAAGYEDSLADSTAVWSQRWAVSDIQVEGAHRDQAYIRFGTFSMLQMAPFHTDTMSVPARAYAFNRYHGLYYWDSETFLLPQYLFTHPDVARNLLSFRHKTLDGARRTAKSLKAPGACFPWMTDSDDGTEQAPWHIGDYVWHQNADIAYAIDQYVHATGDTGFMVQKGLEVIVESARFWISRLEKDSDGVYHLHNTVGPDELDKHGPDNGYSSLMARRHLQLAVNWSEEVRGMKGGTSLLKRLKLSKKEIGAWQNAASRMFSPTVPGLNIPLQDAFLMDKKPLNFVGLTADEAFAKRHTHRVVKQSDIILLMYLLQDVFTREQMRKAYEFYEPMTLHYSSLSYNTHSIIATKIGLPNQAYAYFEKAAGLDLDNLRDATSDGLHAAALGGTWQTIVFGFLGMRLLPNGILFEPHLPEAWGSLALRIVYRGYQLRLRLTHDSHQLTVETKGDATPAQVTLNGMTHNLKKNLQIVANPTA